MNYSNCKLLLDLVHLTLRIRKLGRVPRMTGLEFVRPAARHALLS